MTRGLRNIFVLFVVLLLVAIPVLATTPNGRMTGGGSVFFEGVRVTHGFELHCDFNELPNNLEINWNGNRFHLESLITNSCTAGINPAPPKAPFYLMDGFGTGSYNGQSGCLISFSLSDQGEPGTSDTAFFVITCPDSQTPVLVGGGLLTFGNHQAHRANE